MHLLNVKKYKFFFIISLLFVFTTFNIQNNNFQIPILKINQIEFSKTKYLEENIKYEVYDFLFNKNLFFINKKKIEDQFFESKWIKEVKIKKIFPSKILIEIKEFYPIAFLYKDNKILYVNNNFQIAQLKVKSNELNLIKLNSNFTIKEFKSLYQNLVSFNKFIPNIKEANLISSGRWNLVLKDQKLIKLGRYNLNYQLKLLNELLKKNSNHIIDLRNKKKIYIKKNERI